MTTQDFLSNLKSSGILLRLAEENELWLWHATLTIATAGYVLGFNRALLYLLDEANSRLICKLGIGYFNSIDTHNHWERPLALSFDSYLRHLRANDLVLSPIEKEARRGTLDLSFDQIAGAFETALHKRQRIYVSGDESTELMPSSFVSLLGTTDCVIVPLCTKVKVIGLVVVDNIFSQKQLSETLLDQLETLLDEAVRSNEKVRHHDV